MCRYETRSTMMTSNRPLEDWGKLPGDFPSATAILDRFLHHTEIVRLARLCPDDSVPRTQSQALSAADRSNHIRVIELATEGVERDAKVAPRIGPSDRCQATPGTG